MCVCSSFQQWHSHWGSRGGADCHPDSEKFAKNRVTGKKLGKIGEKRKNQEEKKRQKSGKFFHFAPHRAGYATGFQTHKKEARTALGSDVVQVQ